MGKQVTSYIRVCEVCIELLCKENVTVLLQVFLCVLTFVSTNKSHKLDFPKNLGYWWLFSSPQKFMELDLE